MTQSSLTPSVTVNILQNEYEVKLPNTGQELDIAILLQQLSREKYESFKLSYLPTMQREAVKLEAIAYFNVLIPQLKKDLTVKSLHELSHEQMDKVMEAYLLEFLPWYELWEAKFNEPKDEKDSATPAV